MFTNFYERFRLEIEPLKREIDNSVAINKSAQIKTDNILSTRQNAFTENLEGNSESESISGGKAFLLFSIIGVGLTYFIHRGVPKFKRWYNRNQITIDKEKIITNDDIRGLPFSNNLQRILEIYNHYIDNPKFVYKLCNNRHFVIMEKLDYVPYDTSKQVFVLEGKIQRIELLFESLIAKVDFSSFTKISSLNPRIDFLIDSDGNRYEKVLTNENRKVVDDRFAKFRTSAAKPSHIIDIHTLETFDSIVHHSYYGDIIYKVDEIVYPNLYDIDDEIVCGRGIHYFKDPVRAFFYDRYSFHGLENEIAVPLWDDDGSLYCVQRLYEGEVIDHYPVKLPVTNNDHIVDD